MWLAAEQVQSMKGKKKKTALRWWTECLHSYLMSYFFSEVGEMEPGGGLEQRGVGVREGGGGSGCECTAQYRAPKQRPRRSPT